MGIGVVFYLIGIVGVVAAVDDVTLYTPPRRPYPPFMGTRQQHGQMAIGRAD
jgi:hypothetical protein